jgi:hypothetical protein
MSFAITRSVELMLGYREVATFGTAINDGPAFPEYFSLTVMRLTR